MALSIIKSLETLHGKISLEYFQMPQHLSGKYQYFTCAELKRGVLPETLLPQKVEVLMALEKYAVNIYNELKKS